MMPDPNCQELTNWQWLTSDAGRAVIENLPAHENDPLRLQKSLRKQGLSIQQATLVMQQITLRPKARDKFRRNVACDAGFVQRMFFQSQLLQQSTGYSLAKWKAGKFAEACSVYDICCGLGGDLLALAGCSEGGKAIGVDRSEVACHLARTNCEAFGVEASVQCGSAEQLTMDSNAWFHIDPDRRAIGARTTSIDQFSPSQEALDKLIAQQRNGAIKLAPATEVPDHWLAGCERQWIGDASECKQLVTWFGEATNRNGSRSAVAIGRDGETIFEWVEAKPAPCKFANDWGEFLYEPHATLIAGRMVDSLAAEFGLQKATSDIAYLTGAAVNFAGLTSFQVIDSLRMDEQLVAEALRSHNCGRLEIKKRGLDHQDVDRFGKAVKTRLKKLQRSEAGTQRLVLVLSRIGERYSAVIVKRVG